MAELPEGLQDCIGFQRNAGNTDKNWQRHSASQRRRLGGRKKQAKAPKRIPRSESEDAERESWTKHGVLDQLHRDQAGPASFPAWKPSTTTISVRLVESLLEQLKTLANERDAPYQSLPKAFLAE